MREDQERALREIAVRLDWAATGEHAWSTPAFHVEGMHPGAELLVGDAIAEAKAASVTSPLGVVVQGRGGAGKTHLLGWVKNEVIRRGGYFFLVDFSAGDDFWRLTANAMVEDLGRAGEAEGAETQAVTALRALARLADVSDRVGPESGDLSRDDLDALVAGLVRYDRRLQRFRDTLRALALYAVASGAALDVGHDHLSSAEEAAEGDRQRWGLSKQSKTPRDIVKELSALLALTGPSVIAVDQVDTILKAASRARDLAGVRPGDGESGKDMIEEIAGGLMDLRHTTQRTLCLLACLPSSWGLITDHAVNTARDRFRPSLILGNIERAELARAMVERRFAAAFAAAGFTPPDPVWPVAATAFESARGLTPRTVLRRISEHIAVCRAEGEARLLTSFDPAEPRSAEPAAVPQPTASPGETASDPDLARLDASFAELRDAADVSRSFDHEHEDEEVPRLLAAGLDAWIRELGDAGHGFSIDPLPGRKPALHARLRQSLSAESEEQRHWAFRMICSPNANAAFNRLNAAIAASGVDSAAPDRHLVVLRNHAWSQGPKTRQRLAQLKECGGLSLLARADDLRVFEALRIMASANDPHFDAWVRSRRPAHGTELLGDLPGVSTTPVTPVAAPRAAVLTEIPASSHRIKVGRRVDTGNDLEIDLETLTRHTAVFAGSGSGKTVFLRRLVEECALLGVSSIVLDPNNDMARLGDEWPEPPATWQDGDAAKAARYHEETEVVVWTPGRSRGRPLSFQPLPDFGAVLDDKDELDSALSAAVAALAPRVKYDGASAKAQKGLAVLRKALEHFARSGGRDLTAFIALLSDLPLNIAGQIDKADELAAEAGQLLTAARITDPLFAGDGEPVDPARLLTPSSGKRARVSVISFIGLPDEARRGFVSRLQMALFSWIKRNPARDRPLSGLYVMDEAQSFAPAVPKSEALASTLTLASQARKYGLGLVFATQAPKGLHNQISGNTTTQFIGRINSKTQLDVVKGLAQARGGGADRVARLNPGEFYAYSTGLGEALVRTPNCLSHHPAGPLTEAEIISRASG
ncbi:ATP-binding protein [Actinocorallia sp. A-T 12471]|uniref:ATP-binding protein n=1 Tax=Actinocorallia sp. A-T 12471 TaxID=3089813 RepID=UPI0029CD38C5|nr:ATP-binding protein [Actinocorallia sp. A-T 12471]MDX6741150.1 ATP-binding protein [Actinocorallia sp. A-T 12471]